MYIGEYYDAETGLIYLRNRYYNPATGRFITEDPIRDGLNWYVYCGNNPVCFVDPLGLDAGDFLINGNVINYTQNYNGGMYGSARDFIEAMGGTVGTKDRYGAFNMTVGDISFKLYLSSTNKTASVYNSNKYIGEIRYRNTNDKENPGCVKLQVNLQDAIDVLAKGNQIPKSMQWDLGDVGGTYVATAAYINVTETAIPKSVAKRYAPSVNIGQAILSAGGESDISGVVGSFAGSLLADLSNETNYNQIINSKDPFVLAYTYTTYLPSYSSDTYFFSQTQYLNCYGSQVGSFKVGQY